MLLFGVFYAYDIPAALNTPLDDYLGLPDYPYIESLLYASYSFPNIILPFFGGKLTDKYGTSRLVLVFAVIAFAGQLLFSVGVQAKHVWLMVFGRFVFGVGAESLAVVQSSITSKYFKSKELALAIGVNITVGRLGSVLNDLISPWVGVDYGVPLATWIGSISCLMSLTCAYVLHCLPFTKNHHQPLTKGSFVESNKTGLYLLCGVIFCLYGTMIPFNTIHSAFLQSKWYPNDAIKAGQIMIIPDLISALLVPAIGTFIDKYGQRCKSLILSSLLMAGVHMYFTTANEASPEPLPFLCILGFSYSLLITCWSLVPLLAPDRIATSFGIATSVLNVSMTVVPLIVAALVEGDATFGNVEKFFVGCALAGTTCGLGLLFVDQRTGLGLENLSGALVDSEYIELEGIDGRAEEYP